MYNAKSKILKKEEPSTQEFNVAKALYDLEMSNQELKADLHEVYITKVQEFSAVLKGAEKKALIVFIHFRSLKPLQRTHVKVVEELEKKFKMPVVILAQRQILSKHMSKGKTRARNKTLTAVHEAILEDLVFPANIVGKRIRMKIDGSRVFKISFGLEDLGGKARRSSSGIPKVDQQRHNHIVPLEQRFPSLSRT